MKLLLVLVVALPLTAAAQTTANQQLELTITPAPLQMRLLSAPEATLPSQPRSAESVWQWSREKVGNQEIVTLTVAPSGLTTCTPQPAQPMLTP